MIYTNPFKNHSNLQIIIDKNWNKQLEKIKKPMNQMLMVQR